MIPTLKCGLRPFTLPDPSYYFHCLGSGSHLFHRLFSQPHSAFSPPASSMKELIKKKKKRTYYRAFLVVQWLRIRLPMQRTWVRSVIQDDSTCHRATKPMPHNYWACALEPTTGNYWVHMPQLLKPMCLEPVLCNKRSHCNEKPEYHSQRVAPARTATRESRSAATRPGALRNK